MAEQYEMYAKQQTSSEEKHLIVLQVKITVDDYIILLAFIPTIVINSVGFLLLGWEGNEMQELATAYQNLLDWSLANIRWKWYKW